MPAAGLKKADYLNPWSVDTGWQAQAAADACGKDSSLLSTEERSKERHLFLKNAFIGEDPKPPGKQEQVLSRREGSSLCLQQANARSRAGRAPKPPQGAQLQSAVVLCYTSRVVVIPPKGRP